MVPADVMNMMQVDAMNMMQVDVVKPMAKAKPGAKRVAKTEAESLVIRARGFIGKFRKIVVIALIVIGIVIRVIAKRIGRVRTVLGGAGQSAGGGKSGNTGDHAKHRRAPKPLPDRARGHEEAREIPHFPQPFENDLGREKRQDNEPQVTLARWRAQRAAPSSALPVGRGKNPNRPRSGRMRILQHVAAY